MLTEVVSIVISDSILIEISFPIQQCMFECIFYPCMISNAYTLLIINARVDLTPIYIVCLSCLLVVEEAIHRFKLKLESSTGSTSTVRNKVRGLIL